MARRDEERDLSSLEAFLNDELPRGTAETADDIVSGEAQRKTERQRQLNEKLAAFTPPPALGDKLPPTDEQDLGFVENMKRGWNLSWNQAVLGGFPQAVGQFLQDPLAMKSGPLELPVVGKLLEHHPDMRRFRRAQKAYKDSAVESAIDATVGHVGESLERRGKENVTDFQRKILRGEVELPETPVGISEAVGSWDSFQDWLTIDVAQGAPSVLTSVLVGGSTFAATRNPQLALGAGAATIFPQEVGGTYIELLEAGAPEDRAAQLALTVGGINSVIEQTNLGILLKGNPLFKGELMKAINKEAALQMIKRTGTQALTEATEEYAQQIVSNAAVRVFDENRGLLEGALDSAAVGFVLGGGLGGGVESINAMRQFKNGTLDRLMEKYKNPRREAKIQDVETIIQQEGIRHMMEQANFRNDDVTIAMEQLAADTEVLAEDVESAPDLTEADESAVHLLAQKSSPAFVENLIAPPLNEVESFNISPQGTFMQKEVPTGFEVDKEGHVIGYTTKTLDKVIEEDMTDGVWVQESQDLNTIYSRVVKEMGDRIKVRNKMLQDLQARVQEAEATGLDPAPIQAQLLTMQEKFKDENARYGKLVGQLEMAKDHEADYWQLMKETVGNLRAYLPKGMKLLVNGISFDTTAVDRKLKDQGIPTRWLYRLEQAPAGWAQGTILGEGQYVGRIGLNPLEAINRMETGMGGWWSGLQTLYHEVGHQIAAFSLQSVPQEVRYKLWTDYITGLVNAMGEKSFGEWASENFSERRKQLLLQSEGLAGRLQVPELTDLSRMPAKEFWGRYLSRGEVKDIKDLPPNAISAENGYLINFAEWLAEQAGRHLERSEAGQAKLPEGVHEVNEQLKRFYDGNKFMPILFPTYEKMLQFLGSKFDTETAQDSFAESVEAFKNKAKEFKPEDYSPEYVDLLRWAEMDAETFRMNKLNGSRMFHRPESLREYWKRAKSTLGPMEKEVGESMEDLSGKKDKLSAAKAVMGTLLQIGYDNPGMTGFMQPGAKGETPYIKVAQDYVQRKQQLQLAYDKMLQAVRYGGRHADMSYRLGQLAHVWSIQNKGRLDEAGLVQLAKDNKIKMTPLAWKYFRLQDKIFAQQLDQMEVALEQGLRNNQELRNNPERLSEALTDLKQQMAAARSTHYFPLARFGNHMIRVLATEDGVEANGQSYQKGDTIRAEVWETAKEAKQQERILLKGLQGKAVAEYKLLIPEERMYMGIPPQLIKSIYKITTPDEHGAIAAAVSKASPGDGYLRRWTKAHGIEGYNRDGYRALQSNFLSFIHYLAKIEHHGKFNDAIGAIEDSMAAMTQRATETGESVDLTARQRVVKMAKRHLNYIMNPKHEWDTLSSFAFFWHLAFVPSKMLLNWSQIPAITLPYLNKRYGARAGVELTRAMGDVWKARFEILTDNEKEMLEEMTVQGVIGNGYASALIGRQHAQLLHRMLPGTSTADKAYEVMSKMNEVGAWMFQQSEEFTRRIAALSAYRLEVNRQKKLAKKQKGEVNEKDIHQRAFMAARQAVQQSIFEFGQWNRPAFMRGKAKPLFVFWTHLQHMLEFMTRDKARGQAVVMMLALAGIEGTIGVDDALELMTFITRKLNKYYGEELFPVNMKLTLRKYLASMVRHLGAEDNEGIVTDVMLRGASAYGFGIPWMSEMAGVPMPYFDMHNSLTLGRVIPGLESVNAPDFNTAVTRMVSGVLGAGGGIPLQMMRSGYTSTGDELKQWQTFTPAFIRNPLRSYEWYTRGKHTTNTGAQLVEFDPTSVKHQTEIIMHGMGFPSTRANVAGMRMYAANEERYYYMARRSLLTRAWVFARMMDDREGVADARKAIDRYNKSVPHSKLKISGSDLGSAWKTRKLLNKKLELFRAPDRRSRELFQEVQDVFPDPQGLGDIIDVEEIP